MPQQAEILLSCALLTRTCHVTRALMRCNGVAQNPAHDSLGGGVCVCVCVIVCGVCVSIYLCVCVCMCVCLCACVCVIDVCVSVTCVRGGHFEKSGNYLSLRVSVRGVALKECVIENTFLAREINACQKVCDDG